MPYAIMANAASNLMGTLPAAQLIGTVGNSQLASNSVTVNAGTGLSGGGTVPLGGSTTLNNTGVLSVSGNADITASTVNGVVTLGDTAASANTPSSLIKRDANGNFAAGTITASLAGNATSANTANGFSGSLAGDVTGTQGATVVGSVGGQSAANVASGASAANAATSAATPGALVQRDASGSFVAANITVNGTLTGNGEGLTNLNAAHVSGTLANGQLANSSVMLNAGTGLSGGGTVPLGGSTTLNNSGVLSVSGNGDITASTVNGVVSLGDTAASANTPTTLVKRDANGNFAAGTITASLAGNAASANTANGFSGSLAGDVTGTQGATLVGGVGGQSAASVASVASAANAATSAATPGAIVQRDATGSFVAANITVSGAFTGNGAGLTNLTGVVLAPGSITADKLAPGAVTSNALAVGAIVDADISASGISGNKIIGGDLQAQSLMVGASHTLIGQFATIAGGFQNTISNAAWSADAIGGGQANQINSAGFAAIAGGYGNAIDDAGSGAIAGGYGNAISNSWASTVAGGSDNHVAGLVNGQGRNATVGGGNQNQIVGASTATIAGGNGNTISNAAWSAEAIGGGQSNQITSASFAAIAGGIGNAISNSWASTVAGGNGNLVVNGGGTSAIGGGTYNTISNAWCGTIPGGRSNQVTATYGFAAGYRAHANHGGSFVWGDSSEADVASTGYNQFLIRASGGVGIGTDNPQSALHVVGDVRAATFHGDGSSLTNLQAASLAGAVGNSQLANNSVAVLAGPGLLGGGTVALGGSTMLINAGVLSVTGNVDITASTVGGAVTLGDNATSANAPGTIVKRDASGNFSGGSITASGDVTAATFHGNGGGLTNINAILFNASAAQLTSIGNTNGGRGNFFVGPSGNSATSGSFNTANGAFALQLNTSGSENTANGFNALYSNTSGYDNTANGAWALQNNTSGSYNTAIGDYALDENTSGFCNTAIGPDALYSNTNSYYNTAIGYAALYYNTGGYYNTAIGPGALFFNTSGYYNTAVGPAALETNTSGFNSTAIGNKALSYNTTGSDNTAIGFDALSGLTSGSNNIALGSRAGWNLQSGTNNIYIGNCGDLSESGVIRIGTTGTHRWTILAGTTTVNVLQIMGGADVAEPFDISTKEIPKGAVVVIDDQKPGLLKMSDRSYDKRVAGIVSGANGVNPGLTLRQQGVTEGGENVALSGRVYALADASTGPIKPGDLLTTSDTPGHCMGVADLAKAHGATIGKAMSALKTGRGMVLVLVSLQ